MTTESSQIFYDLIETSRLGQDRELMSLLHQHNSPDSPLYQNVLQLISEAQLQEFDSFVGEQSPKRINPVRTSSLPKSTLADPLKVSLQEVPQLTKTQRRMSMDLMQIRPAVHGTSKVQLSKPAEAAISNVNVVTKVTDLEKNGYTPVKPRNDTLKNRIISYRDKLQLSKKLPAKDNRSFDQKQNLGTKTQNGPFQDGRVVNLQAEPLNHRSQTASIDPRSTRRISFVGENLPVYIRKQLERAGDTSQVTEPAREPVQSSIEPSQTMESLKISGATSHRLSHRILSSLSNSEDQTSKTHSESTDISYGNNNSGSTLGTDKEYILPSLFNRFLDFANEALDHESNESASDEEHQDDDEDDYLFNSQAV